LRAFLNNLEKDQIILTNNNYNNNNNTQVQNPQINVNAQKQTGTEDPESDSSFSDFIITVVGGIIVAVVGAFLLKKLGLKN
jgi:hypothetical protein